jgi:prepilin-type N-terminal cleavage/methylation domain-containing protein
MNRTRNAFTLIELLVVIAIIAILASLTAAAVQKARERGRDAQCRADISQLDTALGQFKARFGIYPPCYGSGPQGTFQLATYYGTNGNLLPSLAAEYAILKQIFPRLDPTTENGLRRLQTDLNPTVYDASNAPTEGIPATNPILLDPNQCMVFFLSGGIYTGYSGFATDPQRPFKGPFANGGIAIARLYNGPFFEGFTPARMLLRSNFNEKTFSDNSAFNPTHLRFPIGDAPVDPRKEQPWFTDPWGTPYLYLASTIGNDYPFANKTVNGTSGLMIGPWGGTYSANAGVAGGLEPFYTCTISGNNITNQKFMNARSVQIISAGRNQQFGPGASYGVYVPGTGYYSLNRQGGDDFSNFQQTPLGVSD